MKTIVAATDFSEDSLNAVEYAADMASAIGTCLLLVNVCPYPVTVNELPLPFYSMEEINSSAEKEMQLLKDKIAARTGGLLKIDTVVQQGDIIKGIIDSCENQNTFAVVMGRSNRGSLERMLVGDTNIPVMQKLEYPLVTVPSGVHFKGLRNIGLACDFRHIIEALPVIEIKKILKKTDASLHVLHVSNGNNGIHGSKKIEASGWFQELMSDLNPHYHFIKGTDTEAEIIEFSDRLDLDLLIVIPKKHDLMEKIFRHSHSKRLVLQAHVPVMAIHE